MHTRLFRFVTTLAIMLSLWAGVLAQSSGFDPSRMDRTTEACDDFFQYANGTWLKNTQIPASEASWGTFNMLRDSNNTILKGVLKKAAATKAKTDSENQTKRVRDSTRMAHARHQNSGTKPSRYPGANRKTSQYGTAGGVWFWRRCRSQIDQHDDRQRRTRRDLAA